MALPFDPVKLRSAGAAVPLAEDLAGTPNTYFGAFSASQNGVLLSHSGGSIRTWNLMWVDRSGKRVPISGEPQSLYFPALSPDVKRAAYSLAAPSGQADIWLQDLEKGTVSRFTFGPAMSTAPLWSPDASYILYANIGANPLRRVNGDFYRKPANSAANPELLLHTGLNPIPYDISRDGKWLVYSETGAQTNEDLWLLPLEGEHKPMEYLVSPSNEGSAQFSPDGKWMVYVSDESGRPEVYVQPIPTSGEKHQISKTGGTRPRWRQDGKELLYVAADGKLMSAPVKPGGPAFDFGTTQPVMAQPLFGGSAAPSGAGYQLAPDGQRFLVVIAAEQTPAASPYTVWLNWQASLKK
jgi:Tol biopolymer transport system component